MDTAFDVSRNPNMIDGKHIVVKTLVLMITLKELKGTEMVRNEKRLLALSVTVTKYLAHNIRDFSS
jgi:hypothetical protein